VVVNLGHVDFIGSTALTALIALRNECGAKGSEFVVTDRPR
jgi:anti-anti-sigma regulatory factor